MRRTRASRRAKDRTIAAVPSSEWSSATITSKLALLFASTHSTAEAMFADSLRAGIRTEIAGPESSATPCRGGTYNSRFFTNNTAESEARINAMHAAEIIMAVLHALRGSFVHADSL